jgi:type II secretory pathway component PulL
MTGFIDWTEGKVSLYIFDRKGNQYIHRDTVSVPLEGELNQSSLSELVKPNIDKIYLSIPVKLLSLRELNFPFSDKAKIKEILPYELEGIILGNTGDYVFDHYIIESSSDSSRVLATCIQKTRLKEIIDLLASVGLDPAGITSLDLRLIQNRIEDLFENPSFDDNTRREAAGEELSHPMVNLRQDELSYRGDVDRLRKSFRLTGTLILILLLVLGSYATLRYVFLKKENLFLKQKTTSIYRSVFPKDARIVDAPRQFRSKLKSLESKKNALISIPVLDILLEISSMDDENITLNDFKADKNSILIKGSATTFEDVDAFKNMLSASFADVRVIDSKSSPDRKIGFSITMKEKSL